MKREILFHGKRIDNGEWVTGDLLHPLNAKTSDMFIQPIGYGANKLACVDPDTVGQFTGLTDIHGIKIFEGDIVIDLDAPNIALAVVWSKGSYRLMRADNTGYPMSWGDDLSVIENVYDNPELIKSEDK